MAYDVKAYWRAVAETASSLTESDYYLMSLDDPSQCSVGGVISQVPKQMAARLITQKTHRIATEAEVAAHLDGQKVKAKEYAEKERDRLIASNPFAALAEASAKKK